MRRIGMFLLVSGAVVGAAVGFGMLAGVTLPGMPWLVAVGLTKLTLLSSAGLMAAGAFCLRLDRRSVEHARLQAQSADVPPRHKEDVPPRLRP